MSDVQRNGNRGRSIPLRETPTGRGYVHTRCGDETWVDENHFTHICDPFRPCTGTYCCTCADFAPLNEVRWADTGENILAYRKRLRAQTPALLRVWRYGAGFLAGGAVGAVVGLLTGFALVGMLVGAVGGYLLGTVLLNRVFDIDYRRMR